MKPFRIFTIVVTAANVIISVTTDNWFAFLGWTGLLFFMIADYDQ